MTQLKHTGRNRAQESTNAIERMYITMRHLFIRGFYKPMGVSGETLREALLTLRPEIYGTIAEDKIELNGLHYVIERLPEGIEACRFINLTSDEGYNNSHFTPIIPPKRRRNCYRIDEEQMNIEITRGRSEIYDILTHLTFLFIESHKIMKAIVIDKDENLSRDWLKLESAVKKSGKLSQKEKEIAITHLANIIGRTFEEVLSVYSKFATKNNENKFLHLIYNLGQLALEEFLHHKKRTITFSPVVRERLGHHIHGEIWANNIKQQLLEKKLFDRPLHIISANMHSVMNTLYAPIALQKLCKDKTRFQVYEALSDTKNSSLREKVTKEAFSRGMFQIKDTSGTNIDVQVFDTAQLKHPEQDFKLEDPKNAPVIIVMDYAFGEQAYETMDELLKPFKSNDSAPRHMNVESISIMGKAGILEGGKGDLMIPTAHLFEGTADNYPFKNELSLNDFQDSSLKAFEGAMVTVLGTSLQNRDLLSFFHDSTWRVIGLEMEGAHYQKAIQAAARLRDNITPEVKLRYAYYASDNPLETGSTLASGGLGTTGVKPTYLITEKILYQIFRDAREN
ncbi:hypothetical protein SAMN05444278_10386 [Psychroflexus salarius]|uniref:Uncharacterized protein n=1 Tax=Psychroflexus salarius TaxID=1155689 RepID=A0A1M4UST7_9FLAO|nr:hypothetical protein [Psychroflexus salarius]SHE59697.1 hypothetical protein SAMN05444278_10386 [Psychroflexus salarius]